MQSYVS